MAATGSRMTVAKTESARWVEGQLGLVAATADGIPTLIGNTNRKKSSTHSGNQNFDSGSENVEHVA